MREFDAKRSPSHSDADEMLRELILAALEADGTIVPTSPEAVARAQAEADADHTELPSSLAVFESALQRASEQRLVQCTPISLPMRTAENLARAAREGGEIPPEVEAQMQADRAAAEGRADGHGSH